MDIDYSARGSISGGHLKDIPQPHVRKFPGPSPRQVTIAIKRYFGIGHHYYGSVDEENNPIWNSEDNAWQETWDDREGKGRTFSSLGDVSIDVIHQWIRRILDEHFQPKADYEFVSALWSSVEWFYREGD
jgi:hypothetical protein